MLDFFKKLFSNQIDSLTEEVPATPLPDGASNIIEGGAGAQGEAAPATEPPARRQTRERMLAPVKRLITQTH